MADEVVRVGLIGAGRNTRERHLPGFQKIAGVEVVAVANRSRESGQVVADSFNIPTVYDNWRDLLEDPTIDAVCIGTWPYMHSTLTLAALDKGKHVLCEKPIALTSAEAQKLVDARDRTGKLITEAFMVKHNPQWLKVRELIEAGRIGDMKAIQCFFSYYNVDGDNIRNKAEIGGGSVMDIGCYPITTSRWVFGEEPRRVFGFVDRDPKFKTDSMTSAILDFPSGRCVFTCSTQLTARQRIAFYGTKGRIEIEIPFNAPDQRPARIFLDLEGSLYGDGIETISFPVCDQYGLQGDDFSRCLLNNEKPAIPLEDAVKNMRVIEALFRSGETGSWETP